MTTVARCSTVDQALLLRSVLQAHGISALVPDEFTAAAVPHHFIAKSGVRLQVADDQAEHARQILGRESGTAD